MKNRNFEIKYIYNQNISFVAAKFGKTKLGLIYMHEKFRMRSFFDIRIAKLR